jgi:peptide/nickel transport system substrate-binding protein
MNDIERNYWDLKAGRTLTRRSVLRGAALGASAMVLAACGAPASAPAAPAAVATSADTATPVSGAAPAATAARPKLGGTLSSMVTTMEPNLEPHAGTSGLAVGVGAGICYSSLLTFKWGPDIKAPSYIPTGDLAESWTQPDDLTHIFKLRPGVKWHNIPPVNGRELVAEDVIYSYERVWEKRTYASLLSGISKIEAVDPGTLKLTLDKPNADLLSNLSQANLLIVARERAEQTGGNLDEPPLIGTGPFILDTFEPRQRTSVKRNPDYFVKGLPYLDAYKNLQVPGDPSLMLSSFRAGAANALVSGASLQLAEDVKRTVPSAVVFYIPADRITTDIILNTNLEMFRDVRVRQAISKAIDRRAIIDTIWQGRARPMAGMSLPDPTYSLPEAELGRLVARDVEGAKRLLKEAGRENLSFEMAATTALSGTIVTTAELIQANLKEVGIATTIRQAETASLNASMQSRSFQAVAHIVSAGAPNGWLYARYYTGGTLNYAKYSDTEMDRLIDQQAVMARDPEGRKKILREIQRKIIDAAAYIPLVFFDQPHVLAAEVKGFNPPTLANLHNAFWTTVWLDK